MCCFSRPVETVADTNIFARGGKSGRQYLVYSMKFAAGEELAMILPIPTPKGSPDDAVKFINLEKYPTLFDDLKTGFPEERKKDDSRGPKPGGLALGAPLPVVEVGSFVASFVPAIKDFARLDKQFRLPDGVWENLPQYRDFGFAVFKLKKPEKKDGQKVHPMALDFPQADRDLLFFPTVHIHDGSVPAKAKFDHALFCQSSDAPAQWEESPGHANSFVKVKETQGIVAPDAHVYRKVMKGLFANKDVGL